MEALNLPTYFFKIKEVAGKKYIFDEVRRRFVLLTPEEWVRQHMIRFLNIDRNYPLPLFSIEKKHTFNRMVRRCDFVVFGRDGNPLMIVECKAPVVDIGQQAFDQASRYNQAYKAPYLLITNGRKHFCCRINTEKQGFEFLLDIPPFHELEE